MKEGPKILESNYDENNLHQVENMNLEETKEKPDWCKRAFRRKQKVTYGIENKNDMTRIHENEVNKISEWNALKI